MLSTTLKQQQLLRGLNTDKLLKMNTPTTPTSDPNLVPDIKKAAMVWWLQEHDWHKLKAFHYPAKFAANMELENSEVEHIWIQEVVLEGWWNKLTDKQRLLFRQYINKDSPESATDWILKFYLGEHPDLKEQEVKESVDLVPNENMQRFMNGSNLFESISEKVLSTETVRDAFERHILTVYGRPSEYNRMYGHHLRTFEDGAAWQKEQDVKRYQLAQETLDNQASILIEQRELIQSLLDALNVLNESGFIWKDFTPEFKKEVRSAITKAQEYLGTK